MSMATGITRGIGQTIENASAALLGAIARGCWTSIEGRGGSLVELSGARVGINLLRGLALDFQSFNRGGDNTGLASLLAGTNTGVV